MRIIALFSVLFVTVFLVFGCASSKLNVSRSPGALPQSVQVIALMPSGGVLADAIGIELLRYGFEIVDTSTLTSIMVRCNLTELELAEPQNIRKLNEQGIDTILLVKSVAGYDNRPESASVKLVATATGRLIIGATWQTGHGGARGSPADSDMRSNLSQAARKIADGIGRELKGKIQKSRPKESKKTSQEQ